MAEAREDEALGATAALEDVADRVERGVVRARDDERGKAERGELYQRDLGLPRPALGDERPRAPLELPAGAGREDRSPSPTAARNARRNASGSSRGPSRPELGAAARRTRPPPGRRARSSCTGGSITVSEARLPPDERCGEKRDHAAVGVADEVVAGCRLARRPSRHARRSRSRRLPRGSNPGRSSTTSSASPAIPAAARARWRARRRRCRGRGRAGDVPSVTM